MSENRKYDSKGWYTVDKNPIARSGIFEYLGSNIHPSLDPNKIYRAYRPDSALNNPETINSFKMIPWFARHEMTGDGNTPAEEVGIQGVTGDDVYFDETDKTLYSKIKAFGKNLIDMIDSGVKQLSIGMDCKWLLQPGVSPDGEPYDVLQVGIVGNHLASVPEGRAGSKIAVMDSVEPFVVSFAMDGLDFQKIEQAEDKTMSPSEILKAIGELDADKKKDLMSKLSSSKAEDEDKETETDKSDKKDDSDEEKVKPKAAMDAAAINAMLAKMVKDQVAIAVAGQAEDEAAMVAKINSKNDFAAKCSKVIGDFDHSKMDELEVAKYFGEKRGLALDSGAEVAMVKGHLSALGDTKYFTPALDSADSADAKEKAALEKMKGKK